MYETSLLLRVMYYLPADDPTMHEPFYLAGNQAAAYLDVMAQFQTMPEIRGYTETTAAGFWRAPDGELYFSEVRVVAVDYPEEDEPTLIAHINRMKMMIHRIYVDHGCRQHVIYVTSEDITTY